MCLAMLGAAGPLLDPLMAALSERPVAGEMEITLGLGRVDDFLARRKGPVERNEICCHWVDFTGLLGVSRRTLRAWTNWRFPAPESTIDPGARRQQNQSCAAVNYRHLSAGLVAR
jgi:hypothetical protein